MCSRTFLVIPSCTTVVVYILSKPSLARQWTRRTIVFLQHFELTPSCFSSSLIIFCSLWKAQHAHTLLPCIKNTLNLNYCHFRQTYWKRPSMILKLQTASTIKFFLLSRRYVSWDLSRVTLAFFGEGILLTTTVMGAALSAAFGVSLWCKELASVELVSSFSSTGAL